MMQTDLNLDHVVQEAALWLVETPKAQRQRSAVVELKTRFPLDARRAIEAIRLANEIRGGANASGSPENRKPGIATMPGLQSISDRAIIDTPDISENLLDLQALRILQRFEMPPPTARAVAFLAYQGGRP